MDGYDHSLSGDDPMTLAEALGLMDEMNQLSDMEDTVRSARAAEDLESLNADDVERLAGPGARQSLEQLKKLTELLEEAGFIRKDGERYELTPRGIRKIGQRSLEDIFATLKRDAFGSHRARTRGRGGDPTDELKTYEFGDPFLLDLPDTVKNAFYRDGAHVPVKLAAEDFSVYRTELMTQSATAILVDVSRSMLFRGCFLAAKKVTLALDSLIRSTFPKDDLYIVGFSSLARSAEAAGSAAPDMERIHLRHEHAARVRDREDSPVALARQEQADHPHHRWRADGAFRAGRLHSDFAYPPTNRTREVTLREVLRCTREGITINTFMLARGHYLMDFVNQMSKINTGRAFYVEPERLGEYILVDYVTHKRRRVA